MAVLRQQLTFVHELYESGGRRASLAMQFCAQHSAACLQLQLLSSAATAAADYTCSAGCIRWGPIPRCPTAAATATHFPFTSAGMVDEGEKEDMLAPLDKRLRHLEITGGGRGGAA